MANQYIQITESDIVDMVNEAVSMILEYSGKTKSNARKYRNKESYINARARRQNNLPGAVSTVSANGDYIDNATGEKFGGSQEADLEQPAEKSMPTQTETPSSESVPPVPPQQNPNAGTNSMGNGQSAETDNDGQEEDAEGNNIGFLQKLYNSTVGAYRNQEALNHNRSLASMSRQIAYDETAVRLADRMTQDEKVSMKKTCDWLISNRMSPYDVVNAEMSSEINNYSNLKRQNPEMAISVLKDSKILLKNRIKPGEMNKQLK